MSEFRSVSQEDGVVFIDGRDGECVAVERRDVMSLLHVALTALRVVADEETLKAAARSCMANLGRARFQ